ncbi:MAG: InlB B-repeat-containing protein, partial [Candidatus Izemoplasmatales bacterium]
IIEGIYYAVDNGADIINLSLGGSYANPLLKDAVDYAKTNEVIIVAASGNDGTDEAIYPAAFDSAISVSSIDETLNIASYSNYGETIDISAPGSNIITTIINNSYASVSGTSFAAPQVAGALALMLSYYPEITYDEAIQRFLLSSVDYGEEGYDQYYGHGIANTFNALTFDFAMVSFETFGASPIDSFYQKVNTTLSIPETPKLEDYAFMGWYKDINFIDPWIFETDRVLENMTLYAKFNKEYHEVTLISNGIIQDTILVKNGETINLPSSSLEGYNFIGWTTDIDNLNFYDNSQIYSNLTLYACFEEIIYHNVSLYVDSNLVDIIAVESGTTYNINSYEKLGYDFDGWYSDETYSTLYVNNQIIQSDVSVYARFTPRIYRVTLLVDGMIFDEIDVTYNQIPSLSTPTKENSYFIDWYIDEELTLIYNDSPITSDLSLYARFEFEAYSVTYFIDDNSYTEWHSANELFYPSNPEKEGYTFNGWYIDEEYTNLYNPILLNQNIDIYGFFELEKYHVVFYEYDQETIIFETYISYGESILPPTITNLPESIFFTYTFSNWSEPTDFVTNDLSIYPIYNKDYIEGSISLNKGIDTISAGQTWINAGISDLDDSLTLVIDGNVDNLTPGKYTIKYHIYDEDVIIDTITRIIKVTLPNREVIIELNKSISTILLGGTYQEAGATCEYGDVLIESFVDTNKEGVYIVKYSVVVNEKTYEKIRYVHVISENDNKLQIVYWSSKKEDTYEA